MHIHYFYFHFFILFFITFQFAFNVTMFLVESMKRERVGEVRSMATVLQIQRH